MTVLQLFLATFYFSVLEMELLLFFMKKKKKQDFCVKKLWIIVWIHTRILTLPLAFWLDHTALDKEQNISHVIQDLEWKK